MNLVGDEIFAEASSQTSHIFKEEFWVKSTNDPLRLPFLNLAHELGVKLQGQVFNKNMSFTSWDLFRVTIFNIQQPKLSNKNPIKYLKFR